MIDVPGFPFIITPTLSQVQGATFLKIPAVPTLVEEVLVSNLEVCFAAIVQMDLQVVIAWKRSILVLQTRVSMGVVLLMEHVFDAYVIKVLPVNTVRPMH